MIEFKNCVSIADPELDKISDKKIVIKASKVILHVSYPLKTPVEFEIVASKEKGFTKADLVKCISKVYHRIYREEKKSTKVKVLPDSQRGYMYNRNTTDGKYGIWGHDIGDLGLDAIEVEEKDNQIHLSLITCS